MRDHTTKTGLIWDGKYDKHGLKIAPPGLALPFQAVETVKESTADRDRMQDLFCERPGTSPAAIASRHGEGWE